MFLSLIEIWGSHQLVKGVEQVGTFLKSKFILQTHFIFFQKSYKKVEYARSVPVAVIIFLIAFFLFTTFSDFIDKVVYTSVQFQDQLIKFISINPEEMDAVLCFIILATKLGLGLFDIYILIFSSRINFRLLTELIKKFKVFQKVYRLKPKKNKLPKRMFKKRP